MNKISWEEFKALKPELADLFVATIIDYSGNASDCTYEQALEIVARARYEGEFPEGAWVANMHMLEHFERDWKWYVFMPAIGWRSTYKCVRSEMVRHGVPERYLSRPKHMPETHDKNGGE